MNQLLFKLEATTQGLFEALFYSNTWRILHYQPDSLDVYATCLARLYSAQVLRDIALHGYGYWSSTRLPSARQLASLEQDLAALGALEQAAQWGYNRLSIQLPQLCSSYEGFLAAFYVDEQLRLMHDCLAPSVPKQWPRCYLSQAAKQYRWPKARDFIAHRIHSNIDGLEVSWLAQEHLIGLLENVSDPRWKPASESISMV